MRIFRTIAIASLFVWSATSCEKYLDVNDDPNKTEFASLDVVLPAAQASTCIHVGGELYNLGGFWAQYHTQSPDAGQYEDMDAYNVSADFFDRTWQELYAGALRDYKYIKDEADGTNNAYYLVATLMEAYTYQVLVDLYGQVPYSEALQGENSNLTPAYDDGPAIYISLLDNIDDAMGRYATDPSNGPVPTGNDLIFGGNMSRWVQFGNTLKLKMLLRAYQVPSVFDQAQALALANGGNLLTTNAQMTTFEAAPNKSNPFYDVNYDRLGGVNHAASQSMVSYFIDNDDIRLIAVYEPNDDSVFTTKPQGDFANRDIPFDDLAEPIVTALKPITLFSAAESYFLQAEALERFGGSGQAAYEAGIQASFAMYGYSDTAGTYYGPGGAYEWNAAGTPEDRIKQIMTQKWAAMANSQNLEAFFEINRTGYPEFRTLANAQPGDLVYSLASVLAPGQSPQRLLFADVSVSRNPNSPTQPNGGLAAPIWWAQ
ncbi:MAG: SusD/RagB family nutrient-binding outer membrane lipoprotein [Owenweeksia sp.]